ncbi:MAG TPA: hypothetical protein VNK48_14460 [Xanthobacteraceae bacterium]|nr:hypothetical protein [Xanthobacteraceae bacterium]
MSNIIFFPNARITRLADHQAERPPRRSAIQQVIDNFSSARPPEPRLSPEACRERDLAQLKEAIRRMASVHGWSADDIWRAAMEEMI